MKYAFRMLVRNPGFALAAILSLGLGIGGNAAIFSLVNAVLLRPLPVENPDELVGLYRTVRNDPGFNRFSYPNFNDYRSRNAVFTDMAAYFFTPVHIRAGEDTERVRANLVTHNYFSVLGVAPSLGRTFVPEDERMPGGHPIVVISDSFWKRRFGQRTSVINESIVINGHTFSIVGVAPASFHGTEIGQVPEIFAPIMMQRTFMPGTEFLTPRGAGWLRVVARLKPDVTSEQAAANLETIARDLDREYPQSNKDGGVAVVPDFAIHPQVRGSIRAFMGMLSAVVGVVLLIACMNISNLLLVRATGRQREIGVRVAMGASRGRLIRQLISESLLVSVIAGVVGLMISLWVMDLVPLIQPALPIPMIVDVTPDSRVIAFTLALSLACSVLFGLAPALNASRHDVVSALKDDVSRLSISKSWLRDAFVVGQVAFALILLIGAGLFIRSLRNAEAIDPGFDTSNLLFMSFDLGVQGYAPEQGRAFQQRLMDEVRALPEVVSVSRANTVPLSLEDPDTTLVIEGYTPPSGRPGVEGINFSIVDEDYFSTLRIPIVRGRVFTAGDAPEVPKVIVNETFVKRFWSGVEPLGKRVSSGRTTWQVVGVARDSKYLTIGEAPRPFIFLPYNPGAQGYVLQIRTAGDPLRVAPAVQQVVRNLNNNLPIFDIRTMDDVLNAALFPARASAASLSIFSGIAVLLSAIGIYGVMAYLASRRVREVGLRMALGARPKDVMLLTLRRGIVITGIGIVLGLLGAFGTTRLVSRFLYGIQPVDPVTFAAVTALLWIIALAAMLIPARRATRVDPMVALRHE